MFSLVSGAVFAIIVEYFLKEIHNLIFNVFSWFIHGMSIAHVGRPNYEITALSFLLMMST